MKIEWNLRDVLEKRGVTVFSLARAMGSQSHAVKLYRIASPDPDKRPRRVDFETLEQLIPAIYELTGETVTPNDLLEITDPDIANHAPEETRDLDKKALNALFSTAAKKLKARPAETGTPEGSSNPAKVRGTGPSLIEIMREGRR
jgi:hypothetical protein